MPRHPMSNDAQHPIAAAAVASLHQGEGEPIEIYEPHVGELEKVIDLVEDAPELARAAEELLLLAVSLDQQHRSPRTSNIVAALADRAARRALDLHAQLGGAASRVADAGERYERFADLRRKLTPARAPKGPVVRVDALDPKRRV